MKTRLLKMKRVDKNNIYTEIIQDNGYIQKEYWWKYEKSDVIASLRRDCNCVIPKRFETRCGRC